MTTCSRNWRYVMLTTNKVSVQLLVNLSSTRFRNCWVKKYEDSEALILLDVMGLDSFLQHEAFPLTWKLHEYPPVPVPATRRGGC